MKNWIFFALLRTSCTAEFTADEDVAEEVEALEDAGDVATEVGEVADIFPEALDAPLEAEEDGEADVEGEDAKMDQGEDEDVEDAIELRDVLEDDAAGELEDTLEMPEADVEEEDMAEDNTSEEAAPCGGCDEGYRCYGGICAKECESSEDCADRCMEGEYCHPLGVCIDGAPIDCGDLKSKTTDECLDWGYGEDGQECCHICDYWHYSCASEIPVWGGDIIHANSFEGVFRLAEPLAVFTGPCRLTHIRLFPDGMWIKAELIDEDRGVIAVLDGQDPTTLTVKLWHPDRPEPPLITTSFNPSNENVWQNLGYTSSALLPTDDPECLFASGAFGISADSACKICNPGAEVSEYSGCPW